VKSLLWAITGAGAHLRDTAHVMRRLRSEVDVRITIAFSKWGYEVSRLYGILPLLKAIASGEYMEEWLVEEAGFYYVGRINQGKYDVVVIAPATGNTVAKMAYGIAHTLPTLIFAEACKSRVPVVILPSDIPDESGLLISEAPCYVDRDLCRYSEEGYCQASQVCPVKAIVEYYGKPRIDYGKCIGCGLCTTACSYRAIKCWEKVVLKPRQIDLENLRKLANIDQVYIVKNPEELYSTVKTLLRGGARG